MKDWYTGIRSTEGETRSDFPYFTVVPFPVRSPTPRVIYSQRKEKGSKFQGPNPCDCPDLYRSLRWSPKFSVP